MEEGPYGHVAQGVPQYGIGTDADLVLMVVKKGLRR